MPPLEFQSGILFGGLLFRPWQDDSFESLQATGILFALKTFWKPPRGEKRIIYHMNNKFFFGKSENYPENA